jgi:anti-sigma-K factor RskA
VAAATLVAIAVPTTIAVDQHRDRVQLQRQADAVAAILADPHARLVASTVPGGGLTTALVSGDEALFSATNMPATPAGKTYQLWVVADGVATSAGLMGEGTTRVVVDAAAGDTLAVTVEPAGGSKQPTTTPIVSLAT